MLVDWSGSSKRVEATVAAMSGGRPWRRCALGGDVPLKAACGANGSSPSIQDIYLAAAASRLPAGGGGAPRRLQWYGAQVCQHDVGALLATVAGTAISRPAAGSFVQFDLSPSLEEEWGRGESMAVCVECVVGDLYCVVKIS